MTAPVRPRISLRSNAALFFAVLLLQTAQTPTPAAEPAGAQGYYRSPTLHGDTIAFVAEGDVWTVGITGGVARRLTSHPGDEASPQISPDGRLIAFAATYEGPTEVYTMPLQGGSPTRRTFAAEPSIPVG